MKKEELIVHIEEDDKEFTEMQSKLKEAYRESTRYDYGVYEYNMDIIRKVLIKAGATIEKMFEDDQKLLAKLKAEVV